MKMIRYDHPRNRPEDWLSRVFQEPFNFSGFSRLFGREEEAESDTVRADLFEDTDNYYARLELPGIAKEDLQLELHDSVLTVSGVHRSNNCGNEETTSCECTFKRALSIPDDVKASDVKADLKNGLLTVTLPKEEARKPRAITIN